MNPSGLHVFLATPCYGLVHQRYMQSAIALLQSGSAFGFRVTIEMLGYDSLVTCSRNALVAKFRHGNSDSPAFCRCRYCIRSRAGGANAPF